jgi:hypothetical protein
MTVSNGRGAVGGSWIVIPRRRRWFGATFTPNFPPGAASCSYWRTPATCMQFKPKTAEPQLDDLPPGYRWFELYPDGRLETGVERIETTTRPLGLTRRVPAE